MMNLLEEINDLYCNELKIWFKCLRIDHVIQDTSWNCGISCIKMILSPDKLIYFNIHEKMITGLQNEEFHSVWTIDLAYILKKLDVNFKYCTSCFGISPELYKHSFYERILSKDYDRLLEKFQYAKDNSIELYKDVIPTAELIDHLSKNGPVIVLTDANLLMCDVCVKNEPLREVTGNFQGHYIVLIGYSLSKNYIAYLDPSRPHGPCFMTTQRFDTARHANGTDHDLILIFGN